MTPSSPDTGERGAALLTVLLIVAALSAIAVAALEDLRRGMRLEANAASLAQAQWYAIGAEDYAIAMAQDLKSGAAGRAAFAEGPQHFVLPLDDGLMEIDAADASACINLNGVVAGAGEIYQRHETGAAQLSALLVALGLSSRQAEDLTADLIAWIDTGDGRNGPGSDDSPYLGGSPGYMTGREPLAEVSELRAVRGFTPEIYATLRPHVCAHPDVGPSRVNLNALTQDDAVILVAMSEGRMSETAARALIAARPPQGWQTTSEIWARPELAPLDLPDSMLSQIGLDPAYLALTVHISHLDAEASLSQLLVDRGAGFIPAGRRWSTDP